MAIEVKSVSKQFGDFVALDDVSVTVRDGSLTALLGPSGGGKSTLLRVIAGLETPDGGSVHIEGAEQIVVINGGKIEQAGTPDDLYDRPANRFVMGFVGAVSELDGQLVRPHDLTILEEAESGAREAIVERVIRVGFEVRVELALGQGEPLTAQLSRAEAEPLDLHEGQIVWVRAERVRELA
jgi:ABC-type sulfate/molybdate transport systems ATPase subunit